MNEAKQVAFKLSKEKGLTYINGYDHPHIIAGQGTLGLEIVEQVPDIDAIVVPTGGGGLLAGVSVAVKTLYPHIKIIVSGVSHAHIWVCSTFWVWFLGGWGWKVRQLHPRLG